MHGLSIAYNDEYNTRLVNIVGSKNITYHKELVGAYNGRTILVATIK